MIRTACINSSIQVDIVTIRMYINDLYKRFSKHTTCKNGSLNYTSGSIRKGEPLTKMSSTYILKHQILITKISEISCLLVNSDIFS
jgi:hypothetical protein